MFYPQNKLPSLKIDLAKVHETYLLYNFPLSGISTSLEHDWLTTIQAIQSTTQKFHTLPTDFFVMLIKPSLIMISSICAITNSVKVKKNNYNWLTI